MNLLLVHSGNAVGSSQDYTFVREQGDALSAKGINVSYFAVKGKGVKGYLSALPSLKEAVREHGIDLVHAHYGLCGALATLQKKVPVVITFHNGETLTWKGRILSSLAAWRSAYNIFVAQHIKDKLFKTPSEYSIIPCGIDMEQLPLVDRQDAIRELGLPEDRPNILFGGSFSNSRKNYPLAKEAVGRLPFPVNLIEMKGFDKRGVNLLLCGCDLLLLPTLSEGSPQVVKEAMACNCPVVATRVADIPELLSGVSNSYVTGFDAEEIAGSIGRILGSGDRSDGRKKIIAMKLDNPDVADRLIEIYKMVLSQTK